MSKLVVLTHLATTFAMVGLIWFVQVVHYPLFGRVGADGFVTYEAEHQRLTTFVVGPLMLAELTTAVVILAWWLRGGVAAGASSSLAWLGVVLLAIIWATTFFVSVPQHGRLATGYDTAAHAVLVSTNWIRTVVWTIRGAIAFWMAATM